MENLEINYENKDSNDIFDNYFDTINLNEELKMFYEFLNEEELTEHLEEETLLTDKRNENYKRYNDINISCLENLYEDFENIVKEIKKIYSFISGERLLNDDMEQAIENKKILDFIYYYLARLEKMVNEELNLLEQENDIRQQKIKDYDYSKLNNKTLQLILDRYNELVLFNSKLENSVFENYNRQVQRKKRLNELYKLINIELLDTKDSVDEKKHLDKEINKEISNINNKILYLEDIIPFKSKYKQEFEVFKKYFSELKAYDDEDYTDLSRLHYNLCEDLKIKSVLDYFEDMFIKENELIKREEKFIYEKSGIKNLNKSLDYISANYMDLLFDYEKEIINNVYSELSNSEYDITNLYKNLRQVVNSIWERTLTKVDLYKQDEDFCFICSNNQFIDEKYQTILITKKMLDRVEDYSDYQIGFVCNFNKNILYVTENDDIMSADYNDMSNVKTPKQIEQEFINFKICNTIALNGFLTKIEAVYYIKDDNPKIYEKALELSNMYNLPLIELKKDKN